MRYVCRDASPVETAPGRVRVSMARHACAACGTTVRPRERALDIEGSMTPSARRMASLAGSSCCYEEADKLLEELADVNFGERTTRSVGDDAEGDSPVARRLLRELAAAGYAPGDVGVCIGDGAAWLRRLFGEWFPNAVSIIDFNAAAGGAHASEYLWAAAGARYGPGTDLAKRWATRLCRLLKDGRADKVLAALRRAGGGECDKAAGYIAERRDRMRYDEYLARGLPSVRAASRRLARPSSGGG